MKENDEEIVEKSQCQTYIDAVGKIKDLKLFTLSKGDKGFVMITNFKMQYKKALSNVALKTSFIKTINEYVYILVFVYIFLFCLNNLFQ